MAKPPRKTGLPSWHEDVKKVLGVEATAAITDEANWWQKKLEAQLGQEKGIELAKAMVTGATPTFDLTFDEIKKLVQNKAVKLVAPDPSAFLKPFDAIEASTVLNAYAQTQQVEALTKKINDPNTSTAERALLKNVRYGLLYGMGPEKLKAIVQKEEYKQQLLGDYQEYKLNSAPGYIGLDLGEKDATAYVQAGPLTQNWAAKWAKHANKEGYKDYDKLKSDVKQVNENIMAGKHLSAGKHLQHPVSIGYHIAGKAEINLPHGGPGWVKGLPIHMTEAHFEAFIQEFASRKALGVGDWQLAEWVNSMLPACCTRVTPLQLASLDGTTAYFQHVQDHHFPHLQHKEPEERVELTLSGLTQKEAEAMLKYHMKTHNAKPVLVSTKKLKDIGTGAKAVVKWEFDSASMAYNGTAVKYIAQLNTDGTVSCNCQGYVIQKKNADGSPKPRRCKHTDAVADQVDVHGLFKKWKKGEDLGPDFVAEGSTTPHKSATEIVYSAKRIVEI